MENQENSKFRTPSDYLKIFFRRKWLFLVPLFSCVVIAIVMSLLMPPLYQSSTTILVEEEKIINPLIQNLAVSTTAAQRMASIREIILSWSSLVELAEKLNMIQQADSQSAFEDIVDSLRKSIVVEMKKPNIIVIAYSSGNPEHTQLVTKTLTDILIEKNKASQSKETDVAIKFIEEQLGIYKRKIKEAEIANLEEQLKGLLLDSTEQHPMVRELRQKLIIAQKQLETGDYKVAPDESKIDNAKKEALKKEIDKLIDTETRSALQGKPASGELDETAVPNAALYKILLMEKAGATGARDLDVNQAIYNMLLQRLETAKITQRLEISKEGTRYSILEPARLPLAPSKPNKVQVILLGLLAGIAIGTCLVFAREFFDNSFLDIEDAKNTLALPVLGAISCITTPEEVESERTRNLSLITLFFVFSALVIIVAYVISILNRP